MNLSEKYKTFKASNEIYLKIVNAIPDDADYLDIIFALTKLQLEIATLFKQHEAEKESP